MPPFEKPSAFLSMSNHSHHSLEPTSTHGSMFPASKCPSSPKRSKGPPSSHRAKSCPSSPLPSSSPPSDYYALTKNALDSMETSVDAVLKFLAREGVSRASITELQHDFSELKYVAVMERAHQYAKCVYDCQKQHQDMRAVLVLLLSAWESLSLYMALQYKQAHRHFHTLRRMGHNVQLTGPRVERAREHMLDLAEESCAAQKGYLLAQAWERRVKCVQ